MNDVAHMEENERSLRGDAIVLSHSMQIDPIRDLDMHTVMTYLESLCKKAQKGDSESAREVFYLAQKAATQLETIVGMNPEILHGVPLTDVPVILGRTGIQRGRDIASLAEKFGLRWERKMRNDANPKIRELVEELASELNKRRMEGEDDSPCQTAVPISEVLSINGWRPSDSGPLWKGWKDAAKFLPSPSKSSAKIWWEVAEAHLQERFSPEGEKWFQQPAILEMAGKLKRADEIDTDEARGTVKKGFRDRFMEAVNRLRAHTT